MSSNFNQIQPLARELPALERLKNQCIMLAPSFLIGSSSFLQVTRKTVKSWNSSIFSQIQPCTAELTALDRLKKSFTYLRSIQNILMMTCWLPGERSLPFGLLVIKYHQNHTLSVFLSVYVNIVHKCIDGEINILVKSRYIPNVILVVIFYLCIWWM